MHDTEAQHPGIVDGLRDSQERLQFFIDHAPGAMAMLDRDMRYIAVNREQVQHAPGGRPVLGRCHYDVYPEQKAEWRAAHQRGLAGEPTKVEQELVARPDGSAIWLRWEVQPWYEAQGTVGGVVLFVEDISARVQSEEAASIARQNLAELIGTIDGIVWEADAATFRFTFVSAQAERLLGYPVSAGSTTQASGRRTSIPSIARLRSATASSARRPGATTSSTTGCSPRTDAWSGCRTA